MKKKISIFIIITFIIFISIYLNSQKDETKKYKIGKFEIEEHAYKNKTSNYDFIIKYKNKSFVFTREEKTTFKKKIISTIKKYKNNKLECIVPLYKNIDKNYMYCVSETQQVSVDYLIKTDNDDFNKIKEKVKEDVIYPSSFENKKEYKNITVYNKNITNNENIIIWDYKGIYIINKKNNNYVKILDYDLYDNVMATITDNYYVIFENTSVKGITKINYYDIESNKIKQYKLKKALSKDSYINGVVKDTIYVTDNRKKLQYEINIKKNSINEIDKDGTIFLTYKNNKKIELSKGDFFKEKQFFDISNNKNTYQLKENKIYKYYKNNSVLLLEMDEIDEWNVYNDEIIILKDGILHSYTENQGLRKIIESNELRYNYKNIYKIWKN